MDYQVEVDAVDLDIDFVGSELSRYNIFIKSGAAIDSYVLRAAIEYIISYYANVCVLTLLDYLMLKELRNVVAE